MIRQKLLHRMKAVCGATSRMMKDKLIVGENQVDGTWLFIFIRRCIIFLPYLRHKHPVPS